MEPHRFDRAEIALLWSGRYLIRYILALAGLVVVAANNLVPALDGPALHIGAPALLAAFVLWRALRAARRDRVMWLAQANLVVLVVLGAVVAMLLLTALYQNRLCLDQPQGRSCAEVARPIIRLFDARRPSWNPHIPANP